MKHIVIHKYIILTFKQIHYIIKSMKHLNITEHIQKIAVQKK